MIIVSSQVIMASQVIVSLYALHAGALALGVDMCGPYHNDMLAKVIRLVVAMAGIVVLVVVAQGLTCVSA